MSGFDTLFSEHKLDRLRSTAPGKWAPTRVDIWFGKVDVVVRRRKKAIRLDRPGWVKREANGATP